MRILQLLTECATLFPEQYEVEKIVDRFVEVPVTREVEVPVEKIVEKNVYIEVPVEKIVNQIVEVPVDRIVEREVEKEKIVYRDVRALFLLILILLLYCSCSSPSSLACLCIFATPVKTTLACFAAPRYNTSKGWRAAY
eukprot:2499633-Rhodomonas_salina.1